MSIPKSLTGPSPSLIKSSICIFIDGPTECHTEWNKSDREGEISYDIPYMWSLEKDDTSELTKQKFSKTRFIGKEMEAQMFDDYSPIKGFETWIEVSSLKRAMHL